jgi:hypothetical protein
MSLCDRCRAPISLPGSSRLVAWVCRRCRRVLWFRGELPVDPTEAMTTRFGKLALVARLAGLRTPGPEVLVYQGRGPITRTIFAEFARGEWVEAAPDLWLSHDGSRLLLSPNNPLLGVNLTLGA